MVWLARLGVSPTLNLAQLFLSFHHILFFGTTRRLREGFIKTEESVIFSALVGGAAVGCHTP